MGLQCSALKFVCYAMRIAMLCYEISTKTPPHTEEFHIFWGKKKSQILPLLCNMNIYYFKKINK